MKVGRKAGHTSVSRSDVGAGSSLRMCGRPRESVLQRGFSERQGIHVSRDKICDSMKITAWRAGERQGIQM
jgi:hypothetical protein